MIHYFDNCATTKVDSEVAEILLKYQQETYFNPSAASGFSAQVAKDLSVARQKIADCLGTEANELLFTSGGTEADNTAMMCSLRSKSGNIVVCPTEHSAVYNCAMQLKNKGYDVRFASPMPDGSIDCKEYLSLVDGNTLLAVMMHVNNETGAVNDVRTLSSKVKAINKEAIIFSDGVQAIGKVPVNLKNLGVDLYSFAGHKIHCTKGIGCLYIKNGIKVSPLIFGGGQQGGLRSGTEYVGGIVALAHSVEKAVSLLDENRKKFDCFKETIIEAFNRIGQYRLNCKDSVPAVLSVAIKGIKAEVLIHMLDNHNIVVGTSSACSTKNKQNRVYSAMGLTNEYAEGIVRISFSKYNTTEEVNFLCQKLTECIAALRKLMKSKTV